MKPRKKAIAQQVKSELAQAKGEAHSLRTTINGAPHLLFSSGSTRTPIYPPAYEVCLYPLHQLLARQAQLRWQILGAGGLLLVGGFVVSHFFSRRLSQPVEELAVESEEESRAAAARRSEAANDRRRAATLRPLFRRRFPSAEEPDHGAARGA